MDLKPIRDFVSNHPDGVPIKIVDGTKYAVPHRDYSAKRGKGRIKSG